MRVVLTHIPRTGGSSLFAGIRAQMPGAKAAEFDSYADVAMLSDRELNGYNLISTYLGSKLFDRLREDWIKILILRDPITRLRSSYWHLRTTPEHYSFASAKAKECSFRDYLASRDAAVIFQATNTQTWTVLGDKSLHFRKQWAGKSDAEVSAMAVAKLASYDFVGFTESLDVLWSKLCGNFGWNPSPLPRLRVNSRIEIGEDAVADDLLYHTALDESLVHVALAQL